MLTRIIITYVLNIFDLCMTLYYTKKFGLDIEGNPIGRWILSEPYRIAISKVVLVALLLFVLWIGRKHKVATIGSWITLGVYIALAVYHIIIFLEVTL